MKFDSIIIGGGLSGLVAGISLQSQGRRTLIVSAGQSALHFFSGSFELYNTDRSYQEALKGLDESHPYSKMGIERVLELASGVPAFFSQAGIKLLGSADCNHFRLTPMGVRKPAWLTLDGYVKIPSDGKFPYKNVTIANLEGFLDFHTEFIAAGLAEQGVNARICSVSLPELDYLRTNPTEMRSTNIARAVKGDVLGALAQKLSAAASGTEAILMPAVLGLESPQNAESLKARCDLPVEFVATLPPSVPGIRTQLMLRSYYQKIGGTYMLGDTVEEGLFEDDILKGIRTVNHADTVFEADSFVLASGSFFSRGVMASQEGVYEPIFGLDVDAPSDRGQWYQEKMFEAQPYMKFGVHTDKDFKVSVSGRTIGNVYAAGSVLSGFNAVKEGCGAGVSILTALDVAEKITRLKFRK